MNTLKSSPDVIHSKKFKAALKSKLARQVPSGLRDTCSYPLSLSNEIAVSIDKPSGRSRKRWKKEAANPRGLWSPDDYATEHERALGSAERYRRLFRKREAAVAKSLRSSVENRVLARWNALRRCGKLSRSMYLSESWGYTGGLASFARKRKT